MPKDIGRACSCRASARVYLAFSATLNATVSAARIAAADEDVFKVGYTGNNCNDRWKALRECRPNGNRCYAGANDWIVLKCWEVEEFGYDDRVFSPWAVGIDGIRRLERFVVAGHPDRMDLYLISRSSSRRRYSSRMSINERILHCARSMTGGAGREEVATHLGGLSRSSPPVGACPRMACFFK